MTTLSNEQRALLMDWAAGDLPPPRNLPQAKAITAALATIDAQREEIDRIRVLAIEGTRREEAQREEIERLIEKTNRYHDEREHYRNEALASNERIAALEAERDALLGRIESWTHEHGSALCPRGVDTYGNGMRHAKQQVAAILRSAKPGPSAPERGSKEEKP